MLFPQIRPTRAPQRRQVAIRPFFGMAGIMVPVAWGGKRQRDVQLVQAAKRIAVWLGARCGLALINAVAVPLGAKDPKLPARKDPEGPYCLWI